MTSTNEIRAAFLDFFARRDHRVVASGPLVPANDPTLMFTNAGMVQFKSLFTGAETRDYDKAATSQKCVRAGGKHNDLENVGYTARHHTFFEMLGNFAFGSYFKERAIELAWKLLTSEFDLDPKRLTVTVYHEDREAFDLWRRISGLPESRIIPIATMDNFWMMGDTGPCGPCSEIFFDHGDGLPGGPPGSADEDGDRFVEIWNLVFMQYEQEGPESRVALPKPSIDTGMGLERIASVLQGTHDNYRIDLFRRLIAAVAEATGVDSGVDSGGGRGASHRVIADHLRAAGFLIADGVLPANEGRGYVLRRILRRAMRHAHMLGCDAPLMCRLVPALVAEMGQAFGELERAAPLITETLRLEETQFHRTLARGLKLLEVELDRLGSGEALSGAVAFKLYDTYGFPLDLTEDALRARGRKVEVAGFHAAMDRQRAEARKAWAGSGETATETVWFALRERHGATEFLGHGTTEAAAEVVALVRDGQPVEAVEQGDTAAILVNQTPFYGESGGQVGDSGVIEGDGARFEVSATAKKLGELHVHEGRVEKGRIKLGDTVELRVDGARRAALRANHSATHLLHGALRRTLGDHVTQKGSLVAPDRLRFDISHPKPLSADQIDAIEAEVNRQITGNTPVDTHLMAPEEAIEAGAMALFGEKYGDEVRVVSMGIAPDNSEAAFSTELCGGTHVRRTGDIGRFKLLGDSAVGAGIRRLEALTGETARRYERDQEARLGDIARVLKTTPAMAGERVKALVEERRHLAREVERLRRRAVTAPATDDAAAPVVAGIAVVARKLDGVPARELRPMIDEIKRGLGAGVAILVTVNDGKAGLAVGVSDDLLPKIDAIALVRAGALAVGGKGGGGRPDLAVAGGPDGGRAEAAIAAIKAALREMAGRD